MKARYMHYFQLVAFGLNPFYPEASAYELQIISSNQSVSIKNDRPSIKMDITYLLFKCDITLESR